MKGFLFWIGEQSGISGPSEVFASLKSLVMVAEGQDSTEVTIPLDVGSRQLINSFRKTRENEIWENLPTFQPSH